MIKIKTADPKDFPRIKEIIYQSFLIEEQSNGTNVWG